MRLIIYYCCPSRQVVHHYLHSAKKGFQTRLRKRVRNGRATFTFTVRKPEFQGQVVEVKQPISLRDYNNLLSHRSGPVPVDVRSRNQSSLVMKQNIK